MTNFFYGHCAKIKFNILYFLYVIILNTSTMSKFIYFDQNICMLKYWYWRIILIFLWNDYIQHFCIHNFFNLTLVYDHCDLSNLMWTHNLISWFNLVFVYICSYIFILGVKDCFYYNAFLFKEQSFPPPLSLANTTDDAL